MSTYYVNLDLGSVGGSGTDVDPWSATDWQAWAAANVAATGHIFNMRGSHDFGSSAVLFQQNGNCTFKAWDAVMYGPWRISCGHIVANSGGQNGNVISGAIIKQVDSIIINIPNSRSTYYYIVNSLSIGPGISIYGCLLNVSGNFYGSNFSGNVFQDCAITASTFGSAGYGVSFNNCVMSGVHVSYTLSNCQTDWVVPSLPAWDADSSAFDVSVLYADVDTPPQPGNAPYTGYETGLWGNSRMSIGCGLMALPVVDVPEWIVSYPVVNSVGATTVSVNVRINESGVVYYVVVPAGAAAPSAVQVKAGTDASDIAVGFSGSVVLDADVVDVLNITNLVSETDYDIYVVAEDTSLNLQASPVVLSVTTSDITEPEWTTAYPVINTISGTTALIDVNLVESGTVYFVVLPADSVPPTSTQVKAGMNADNVVVGFSGNVVVTANVTEVLNVINLVSETDYDIYVVAEDTSLNLQASPVVLSITTIDITKPEWITMYPKKGLVTVTTASVLVRVSEGGTVYGVAVVKGSVEPTPEQVKVGKNGLGQSLATGLSGTVVVTANVENAIVFSNLLINADYDSYFVIEDNAENLQDSVMKVQFTTLPLISGQKTVNQAEVGQILQLSINNLNVITTKNFPTDFKIAAFSGEGYEIISVSEKIVDVKITKSQDVSRFVNVKVGDGFVISDNYRLKIQVITGSRSKSKPVSYGGANITPPDPFTPAFRR